MERDSSTICLSVPGYCNHIGGGDIIQQVGKSWQEEREQTVEGSAPAKHRFQEEAGRLSAYTPASAG